jgi:hypothetical protein
MIEHEKSRDEKSGTIALLRLLRALEFTHLFLVRGVVSPTETLPPKQVAWDVYKETLHKRHNRAARAGIWLATATLPKRETLREALLRGEIEPETGDKCLSMIGNIYRDIHKLYEDNDLLELVLL